DPTAPLTNFGPVTPPSTQTMTNQDCGATGFSSIGSFQDQASCMVPVAVGATTTTTTLPTVTTTTLLAGPTTTTLPCTWALLDKWSEGIGYVGMGGGSAGKASTCTRLVRQTTAYNQTFSGNGNSCICGDSYTSCQNRGSIDVYKDYGCGSGTVVHTCQVLVKQLRGSCVVMGSPSIDGSPA